MTDGTGQTQDGRATVDLTFKSRPENLALARLALTGIATRAGVSDETLADLKLAVTEACTNAIQHAYGDSVDGDIVVRYSVEAGRLSIEVEDRGAGFDAAKRAAGNGNGNGNGDRSNQGLGLMIIREISDELTVTTGAAGTRIVFVKRLSDPD